MNYDEMSDFEVELVVSFIVNAGWYYPSFKPCNNPSDAWNVIVDNGIGIDFWGNYWAACIHHDNGVIFYHEDKNPLRAAMICFLKMNDAQ